jgi:hypothetical protein
MARSRNIKPGFCQNEYLVDLPVETRLLFALLPMFADRDGRLEDRPKKIKMQVFPADSFDLNPMLQDLHDAGFILRYTSGDDKYIQVVNFMKHQNPHIKEQPSTIPAPDKHQTSTVQEPTKAVACPADSLLPLTDSLQDTCATTGSRFNEWWKEYPKKVGKKTCKEIWKRRKLDTLADTIIADTQSRPKLCAKWRAGYIQNPTTYLNGDRWEDDYETNQRRLGGACNETPVQRSERVEDEALGISH